MIKFFIVLVALAEISVGARVPVLSPCEGFSSPQTVVDSGMIAAPLAKKIFNSIYKIEMGSKFGTAFVIDRQGYLLTNVHNLAECLRSYGYLESGYDGSRGPLSCDDVRLISSDGTKTISKVDLLGAFPMQNVATSADVALIRVHEELDFSLELSEASLTLGSTREPYFIAGYPRRTFRDVGELKKIANSLDSAQDALRHFLGGPHPTFQDSSDLMTYWIKNFFVRIQPHFWFSHNLNHVLIGSKMGFSPFFPQPELGSHAALSAHNCQIGEVLGSTREQIRRVKSNAIKNGFGECKYPDADGSLTVTRASLDAEVGFHMYFQSDGGRGCSGSPVLNSEGTVIAIVNAGTAKDPKIGFFGPGWSPQLGDEPTLFEYCQNYLTQSISAEKIREGLHAWGFKKY